MQANVNVVANVNVANASQLTRSSTGSESHAVELGHFNWFFSVNWSTADKTDATRSRHIFFEAVRILKQIGNNHFGPEFILKLLIHNYSIFKVK